jgi:hypothetical protein
VGIAITESKRGDEVLVNGVAVWAQPTRRVGADSFYLSLLQNAMDAVLLPMAWPRGREFSGIGSFPDCVHTGLAYLACRERR